MLKQLIQDFRSLFSKLKKTENDKSDISFTKESRILLIKQSVEKGMIVIPNYGKIKSI